MGLQCHGVAQSLGERHNSSSGITPLEWLEHFGNSLNLGSGLKDINRPLPLICRASPSDRSFTAHDDGRACPSLQNFLALSVENLTLTDGQIPSDFLKGGREYSCRLRLLGNAMSRPPLQLGNLCQASSGPGGNVTTTVSALGKKNSSDCTPKPVIYPVDHDLETTLLVVEVSI